MKRRTHPVRVARTWSAIVAAGIGFSGCSDPVSVRTDILAARIVDQRLELTNRSTTPVYYFAADKNMLALIDWVICTQPSECNSVAPRSTRSVPFRDIPGAGDGSEIVVYHWRLVPGQSATGYVADSLRTLTVADR